MGLTVAVVAPGVREVPPNQIDTLEGAGALRSTGNDLAQFIAASIAPPDSLRSALLLLQTPPAAGKAGTAESIGRAIVVEEDHGAPISQKSGGTAGLTSFRSFSPARGTGVAVLANQHAFGAAKDSARALFDRARTRSPAPRGKRVSFAFGKGKPTDPQGQWA